MEAFADLPDALVRDLLAQAESVAGSVTTQLTELAESRGILRERALANSLIKRKADLDVPREPSVVGIDGSYSLHHLTATDVCAVAALAVEGVIAESRREWIQPYHRFWTSAGPHISEATQMLRSLMVLMEVELIRLAPHDLVLMDGSFLSLIIYLNQGLSVLPLDSAITRELQAQWERLGLDCILQVLTSTRVVSIPKFTSRNELALLGVRCEISNFDARTLATYFLEPGEYTRPLPLAQPAERPFHLAGLSAAENSELDASVRQLHVLFFRPFGWAPAIRVECSGNTARSDVRLALVLEGLQRQFFSPAVTEPYPLFLADRMVKSLGAGLNVIEQNVAQHVAERTTHLELAMLCLQNYRTEGGQ